MTTPDFAAISPSGLVYKCACNMKTSLILVIFCSKGRGERTFEINHCPFEDWADICNKIELEWPNQLCELAGGLKGKCRI